MNQQFISPKQDGDDSLTTVMIGCLVVILIITGLWLGPREEPEIKTIPQETPIETPTQTSTPSPTPLKIYRVSLYGLDGSLVAEYETHADYLCYNSDCSIISFIDLEGRHIIWNSIYLHQELK
jgi:hypothetical protein